MQEKYMQEMYTSVLERTIKRLWVLCIILIVLFFGSNAAWIYYENQFEDVVTTITQDLEANGGNATINDGVHIYGESTANTLFKIVKS